MSSFRTHRIIIASLFLPETVVLGEGSEPSTPTLTVTPVPGTPARMDLNGARSVSQQILQMSGTNTPRTPNPKPPAFARQFSMPTPPPRSIVQDLTDKSRAHTPQLAPSPSQEIANPFSSFKNPLEAAVHALGGDKSTRRSPPGPERLQPRLRRASRSASRHPKIHTTLETKWHIDWNPRCNGGLYNAVNSVHDRLRRKLWVGVLGTQTDGFRPELRADIDQRMRVEAQSLPVWIPDEEFSKCYDGFCHQVLWPCLHYAIPDAPKVKSFYENETWKQYCAVNQKFADAIVANYEEGDIIWINDYHLMLLPSMVRAKLPDAAIGFFMHVAFPSSEIFRCLSTREQLVRGVLAADLVGFQTANYARHFRQTVSRILTFESVPKGIQTETRFVDVAVFPMGVDVKTLNIKRKESEVAEWVKHLQDRYAGLKMIVGRDKLDEIAGVRHKLRAFELFLEKYPEFQGKVVLIQVALSTTMENEVQGNVVDIVGRINSKFSTLIYQPVVFLHTDEITFSQYLALLTAADALLVTSLREGMALRTHEFVICQEGRPRPSPLILSEFTGSYSYSGFRACLSVNPWDTRMTAQAIYAALTMSDVECKNRWRDLHAHVVTQTAQAFVSAFLTRCLRVHMEHQKAVENTEEDGISGGFGRSPPLDVERVLPRYRHAHRRLLLIDFEGTLWLRDPRSREFDPPKEAIEVLDALSQDERNEVWLLSGLPIGGALEKVAEWVPDIGLCAENGCFLKPRGAGQEWINTVANFNLSWKAPCIEMLQYFTERTPGSFIEEREASIVWRFWTNQSDSQAERQWATRQAAEAQNHIFDSLGEKYGLRIIPGENAFLVLPNNVSRSSAVGAILAPGGPARAAHLSLPRALWMGMALDADHSTVLDPDSDLGIDFVLAVSGDEKLLRRLNELECAETVSSGSRGPSKDVGVVGTDAKWTVDPAEVIGVLRVFADAE